MSPRGMFDILNKEIPDKYEEIKQFLESEIAEEVSDDDSTCDETEDDCDSEENSSNSDLEEFENLEI